MGTAPSWLNGTAFREAVTAAAAAAIAKVMVQPQGEPAYKPRRLHPFNSLGDYQEWLSRRGFAKIGGGWYGSVWAKEGSPWVIKMGNNLEDGWPAFAAMVMEKHANNPFAPRIHSLRWHTKREPFYVAVIERLEFTVEDSRWKPQTEDLQRLVKLYRSAAKALSGQMGVGGYVVSLALIQRRHPELFRLIQDIRQDLLPDSSLDFHDANAMIAGDRLVVTDPISSTTIDTRTTAGKRRAIAA